MYDVTMASELVEALQKLIAKHGDCRVTYVDNGEHAEEWPKIYPVFCPEVHCVYHWAKINCIVL